MNNNFALSILEYSIVLSKKQQSYHKDPYSILEMFPKKQLLTSLTKSGLDSTVSSTPQKWIFEGPAVHNYPAQFQPGSRETT